MQGDAEAVRDALPFLSAVSRETDDGFGIKYGPKTVNISAKAIDLPYGRMRRLDVEQGRYFEADDFSEHRQVIIFGSHAAEKLFNGYPPVGEVVQVEGQPFTVIGVLRNKIQDSSNNGPDNENVFVPFDTMRTLRNQVAPDMIVFQPSSPEMHLRAIQAVRAVLAQRHHFDPRDDKAVSTWDTIDDAKSMVQFSIRAAGVARHHRSYDARGGWSRRHEHHAGLSHRTHARDRPDEGAGRAAARHHAALPAGELGADADRRY